ncbi:MAG TPA: isoprenylcysteine carboxylmethyltransferase family protein [Acidimicrobiales bacterium]|nr:isoprenylcysteine carboxylmethyltransferase family protein [Acidimicrobiales bacterium]
MTWAALGGLVSYLAAVIVVRSILSRRSRQTRFVVLEFRRWQPAEWVAALIGVAALVSVAAGAVLAALGHPGPKLATRWQMWTAGTALITAGTGLMAWAQISMSSSWRVGLDRDHSTELVKKGPFSVIRNPIYVAMVVVVAGVTLLDFSAVVAAGWVLVVLFVMWQVRAVEEPFLVHAHGDAYAVWAHEVGRFLPRISLMR